MEENRQIALESPAIPGASAEDNTALAKVVAVADGVVWLEPMQTGSCGSCASAALCGSKGIGSLSSRLKARRFAVPQQDGLSVGDTVLVAFAGQHLVRAAMIAYVVPLLSALLVAALVQAQAGQDALTLLGALLGMAGGFGLMRWLANKLEARGALRARIVRRNPPSSTFYPSGDACDA